MSTSESVEAACCQIELLEDNFKGAWKGIKHGVKTKERKERRKKEKRQAKMKAKKEMKEKLARGEEEQEDGLKSIPDNDTKV